MTRVEKYKKRKKICKGDEMHMNADKDLVKECLNSDIDENKIKQANKATEDHYNFTYDFNVSSDEAKEFLDKFKKEFSDERFNKLISDCKNEVIKSIVVPFGLGKVVAAYDKTGGNVTTIYNFEKGITATLDDHNRYGEWQRMTNPEESDFKHEVMKNGKIKKTSPLNQDRKTAHDKLKNQWKKDTYQKMKNGEIVKDGYTGEELGTKINNKINKNNVSINGEHITSVGEIEKDAKNHLFAKGDTTEARLNDRANVSGNKNNLTLIEGGMNSSKNDSDLMVWANSPISKKHAKETGNPNMTNAEYYKMKPKLLEQEYKKSNDFIYNEQLKKQAIKQTKEVVSTGMNEGAKMGTQQALGLVITEFFTAVFDEILDIYKNGFTDGFDDDRFFSVLKERLKKIAIRVKNKWKDAVVAFKDGFISGFISNLVTTVINMFVTTGKRIVRIIREGLFSLFRAVKLLLFPPEDMSYEDAMHEAKKLIASGLIISLGVIAEEYIDILIKGTVVLEPFSDILTSIFVGAITGLSITMVVYYIDKKKNDKDMINALVSDTNQKFDNLDVLFAQLKY